MEVMAEGVAEPFAPGNLVRLREPYKLMGRAEMASAFPDRQSWDAWPGFGHGIIVEVLERGLPRRLSGGSQAPGPARRVSLHLYDPARALLYVHAGHTVPAYVDFHVDELRPHKVATDEGYATLPDLTPESEAGAP